MVDFFQLLYESGLVTAAFIIGALTVIIAIMGSFKQVVELSGLSRFLLASFGLLLIALSIVGLVIGQNAIVPPAGTASTPAASAATSAATPVLTPTSVPTSTGNPPKFSTVTLEGIGVREESNLELPAGTNYLLDVPFETGWSVATQSSDRPASPTEVEMDVSIQRPINVYLLLQGGTVLKELSGEMLGTVLLTFDGGQSHTTPLVIGDNIRDWSLEAPNVVVTTCTSPHLEEAHRGYTPEGRPGRMDMLTIQVPEKFRDSRLESIRLTDTSSEELGSQNPCIHLLAVTVEHIQ